MKILLVDDNEKLRSLVIETLALHFDAEVTEASNGREGMNLLEKNPFDLIILDSEMPVMNGYEFLGHVRSEKKTKELPVVIMTAYNDKQTISRFLNLSVSEYILKPFTPEDLIDKIQRSVKFKKKLLIIDDNVTYKNYVEKIVAIKFTDLILIKAENGADGLEKTKKNKPDLILLDINIPKTKGAEFFNNLRDALNGKNVPIILMITDENDKVALKSSAENNIAEYVLKTGGLNEFSQKINHVLRKIQ